MVSITPPPAPLPEEEELVPFFTRRRVRDEVILKIFP